MSIYADNTADFFYASGLLRGLANESHDALGSICVGLMGAVAAINLRDRIVLHKNTSRVLWALGSLMTESVQALSGLITGLGIRTIYRAAVQVNLGLAKSGIAGVFAGAALSACAMEAHRYLASKMG